MTIPDSLTLAQNDPPNLAQLTDAQAPGMKLTSSMDPGFLPKQTAPLSALRLWNGSVQRCLASLCISTT